MAQALPRLAAEAQSGPDAETIDSLDRVEQALAIARAQIDAAAPRITWHRPAEGGDVRMDDAPLPDGTPVPITARRVVWIAGQGQIEIDPGPRHAAQDAAEQAQTRLARLLARFDVADAAALRAAARDRREATEALAATQRELLTLAPAGLEALRAEIGRLVPPDTDAPPLDPEVAQTCRAAAQRHAEGCATALEQARRAMEGAQVALARAQAQATMMAQRSAETARARENATPPPDLPAQIAALQAQAQAARSAETMHAASAPDLAALRAAHRRAQDVVAQASRDNARLREEIARAEGEISRGGSLAIDEELAEVEARLDAARATRDALRHEAAVLRRLIGALREAQDAARSRYFAPVLAELRPMLHLLWPGATLHFDGDSLLPQALERDGLHEALTSLSGGTREQIALLVRLAFARLLARRGDPAPVLLDDALVYTDDARIEVMFDALHRQAQDLQILVFSCRTRAMRALGGHRLAITPLSPSRTQG